ncbi:uncharacterized protein TNIN_13431 [Trichonephila inaurata madagascariensis]|uniref:Uncharacterized protein n=1 Tax=Trichonephila inaurata madagascariensis TaxID=2747483 RepID=A0A8X6YHT7_9ARAC|nr:uncharacterized protein TNIN_13431 [Trichonephila inaurata madagascariensis]
MSRNKKTLTLEQIETIRSVCQTSRETDEMCLLVWLLIETNLKPRHLLGLFNQNPTSRNDYLQGKIVLPGGVLFSKRHHAYLTHTVNLKGNVSSGSAHLMCLLKCYLDPFGIKCQPKSCLLIKRIADA